MKEGNMNRRLIKAFIGCAIISAVGANAHAAYDVGYVWNWKTELTASQLTGTQPTGTDSAGTPVWSYQYGNTNTSIGNRDAALNNFSYWGDSSYTSNGSYAWQIDSNPDGYPRIGSIEGAIALHPSTEHNVVLTWVSPVSGTLHIAGAVQDLGLGQTAWGGVNWYLDKVSQAVASNLGSGSVLDTGTGATNPIDIDVMVNAGDSVLFIVNAGLNQDGVLNQWGDKTAYDVTYTLTSVPEVSSLAVLAVGSGLLVGFKKRKHA